MKDSTIKLLFAGAVTIGGLIGMTAVVITSMVTDVDTDRTLALAALPAQALTAGLVFFLGHQNGVKRTNGS